MTDAEQIEWADRVARANQIADAIQGTCDDLEAHTTESERGDANLMSEVNDIVFCCSECGWWCEVGEQSDIEDDQVCEDCNG